MHRARPRSFVPILAACALLIGGCVIESGGEAAADSGQVSAAPVPGGATPAAATGAPVPVTPTAGLPTTVDTASGAVMPTDSASLAAASRPRADMRIEVDLAARRLHVFEGEKRTGSYPVAVGSPEWPTQTGEWLITQVVWNPEWIPPDEAWARDAERKAPGAPDNPLGVAQLIYDPPRTLHGTNEPTSIGKAVSHGSIRLSNEDVSELARRVMAAAGMGESDAWYRRVRENRGEKQIVDLQRVVPIRVH